MMEYGSNPPMEHVLSGEDAVRLLILYFILIISVSSLSLQLIFYHQYVEMVMARYDCK